MQATSDLNELTLVSAKSFYKHELNYVNLLPLSET